MENRGSRSLVVNFLRRHEMTAKELAALTGTGRDWVYAFTRGVGSAPGWFKRFLALFDAAPEVVRAAQRAAIAAEPEWRTIPGFSKYEACEDGRVRRFQANAVRYPAEMKSRLGRDDYLFIALYDDAGIQRSKNLHRLIALAFHGEPPADRPYACHRDGNPRNNHARNLYWGSARDNARDWILLKKATARPIPQRRRKALLDRMIDAQPAHALLPEIHPSAMMPSDTTR
jgi:hypothetical protein